MAEDAIARAKAIAARLAGTTAIPATTPDAAPTALAGGGGVANGQVDAVAEAALAAAFGGGAASAGAATSGAKRKRWSTEGGSDNAPAANGSSATPSINDALAAAMSAAPKRSRNETTKKIYIPVEKNPGYNYIGLLIGPGGSKQRELVEQSGGNVKISVRGRGSSSGANASSVPGMPEEPLHVLLEGNEENVENAERLVSELINDSSKAQAEKEKQLAVVSATKGGGAPEGITGTYQPKPVAQLLGLNGAGGHYGPGSGDGESIEEKIGVPNGVVGYIIGKGGESITSMQRKSGCRVQIQKEHEMEPGSTQRIITLIASTQESINSCRQIIEDMVSERLRLNQEQQGGGRNMMPAGGGPGANAAAQAVQMQHALADGHSHVTVTVPNNDVGLVIGKGGATIRSIQERSGANVQIPQGPDADNPMIRTVNITHPQKEGADFAKTLIEEIMSSKMNHQQGSSYGGGSGGGGNSGGNVPGGSSIQIQIPDKDVGMCIGKSGCVIREMQAKTQTRIQIPSQPTPGQPNRIATVSGSAEGCQKVQEIINRIIMEQSSQFVMAGAAFQQGGGGQYGQQQGYGQYGQQQGQYGQQQTQQGQQAQQGQPDYSAQWAAYYANLGQTNQAGGAAQSSETAAAPAAAAPAPASATAAAASGEQPKADAYYDDFFRYAYHYGEESARQYYGAWSPPAGTTNPYGTNPALAAAGAKAGDAGQANASQTNDSSSSGQPRDSSVRNVSNLPAWMTKS